MQPGGSHKDTLFIGIKLKDRCKAGGYRGRIIEEWRQEFIARTIALTEFG